MSYSENKDHINKEQLDSLITEWHEIRTKMHELEVKEKHHRDLIKKFMDNTGADIIQGKELEVKRGIQKRHILLRENMPKDIYEKYSQLKNVEIFYIRKRKSA